MQGITHSNYFFSEGKSIMRKSFVIISGILLLAIFLNGCTWPFPEPTANAQPPAAPLVSEPATNTPLPAPTVTETATATPSPTPTFTPTSSSIGPDFAPNINPLTGLPVTDTSLLDRRPLAIKVSNFPPDLRPHSGMSFADLVFHYYTEQGMTRFLAFYLGQDSPSVGPIRSARMVDAQLTVLYQSILAYVGGDPTVIQEILGRLANRAISERPSTCPGICRGPNGDVNSVFADTAALTKYADTHNIPGGRQMLGGMVFDPVVPSGGQDLSSLLVEYNFQNRSEWRYDPASGRNARFIESWKNGEIELDKNNKPVLIPLIDRVTKQPISAANAVVLFARYTPLGGNEKYEVEFWSLKKGRALLFRDGKLFDGFWQVTKFDAPLVFKDAQGNPLPFKPGNTWFEVVGEKSILKGPADGNLHVLFEIP
jgi:hypothetical protein